MKTYFIKIITVLIYLPLFGYASTLQSLHLESNATHLNVGDTVTLSVVGTYSDNSTKTLTNNIEYLITPSQSVRLSANTLEVLKDGSVTVQATVGGVKSNTVILNIVWVVDGHVLPPEPDPAVNNATLLGIDVNDNGVRDDMERYIIQTYGKEEITIQIGFQVARAYNTVIEHPENAWETYKVLDAAQDCEIYFSDMADMFDDPILLDENILTSKKFKSLMLNTRERIKNYLLHEQKLSGGIFGTTKLSEMKLKCSFNADSLLKARK